MAVRFDASGEHYTRSATGPTSWTMVCWFYRSSDRGNSSQPQGPFGYGVAEAAGQAVFIAGSTIMKCFDLGGNGSGFGSLSISDGVWYCTAITVTDNSTPISWYHGTSPTNLTLATSPSNATSPTGAGQFWFIGHPTFASEWWDGRVAHMKIYDAVLTKAEIEAELSNYYPQRTSNLLQWHPFTEASTTDFSGNGNTLTSAGGTPTTELGPDVGSSTFSRFRGSGVSTTTDGTTHSISVPTVPAGDLLVCLFSSDGNPTLSTSSTGWTKLTQASHSTSVTGGIFYKVATGSDALSITTSASEQTSHVVYSIASPVGLPSATSATGSSNAPNAPSHTPAEGNRGYMWINWFSGDGVTNVTSITTNYWLPANRAASGSSGASTMVSHRLLSAASEDPGAFGTQSSAAWVAWTVSVPAQFTVAPKVVFIDGAASEATGTSGFGASYENAEPNDLLITFAHTNSTRTIDTPTGWTEVFNNLSNGRDYIFSKVWQTGDGTGNNFLLDTTGPVCFFTLTVRWNGSIPGLIVAPVKADSTSGNLVASDITPPSNLSLRLDFLTSIEGTSGASTLDMTLPSPLPSGMGSLGLVRPTGATGYVSRAAFEERALLGATGTRTAVPTDTGNAWTAVTLAVGDNGIAIAWTTKP